MNEVLQRNAGVLQRRWPDLYQRLVAENSDALHAELVEGLGSTLSVYGIQLTSRHDRVAEARQQATCVPADASVAHLYGGGLGDLQRELLARPSLIHLHVHILNGALFMLVLQLLDQTDWLDEPRVVLGYAGDAREIHLPYFALPSELVLADDYNARIRDRLISENHLAFNNRHFDPEDPANLARLEQGMALFEQDSDVGELFDTRPGCEALVIATGPSLATHLPRLEALCQSAQRPLVICVDTAYVPLRRHGIVPDLVMSIDHNITARHLPAEGSEGVGLVYFLRLDAALLGAWRGRRYGSYSHSRLYDGVRARVSRAPLHSGGSVLHPAVDLAVRMGAARVTLFGADFAFPHDRTHTGWQDGDLGPRLGAARQWVLDGRGQKVKTQLNFRGYLTELERYIARHPQVRFFNTSRDGALISGTDFDPQWTLP